MNSMKNMKPVVIGTVGAGYAAHLHGNGYEKVNRVPIRLKGICDMQIDLAEKVKERYGYEYTCTDYIQGCVPQLYRCSRQFLCR